MQNKNSCRSPVFSKSELLIVQHAQSEILFCRIEEKILPMTLRRVMLLLLDGLLLSPFLYMGLIEPIGSKPLGKIY